MNITPEMIQALRVLRVYVDTIPVAKAALDVLDNGGIFAPIDEVTDYNVSPEPEPQGAPRLGFTATFDGVMVKQRFKDA